MQLALVCQQTPIPLIQMASFPNHFVKVCCKANTTILSFLYHHHYTILLIMDTYLIYQEYTIEIGGKYITLHIVICNKHS